MPNFELAEAMLLRDYFAAQALRLVWPIEIFVSDGEEAELVAQRAYIIADAMLAERNKKGE